jgi:hypothetical protein
MQYFTVHQRDLPHQMDTIRRDTEPQALGCLEPFSLSEVFQRELRIPGNFFLQLFSHVGASKYWARRVVASNPWIVSSEGQGTTGAPFSIFGSLLTSEYAFGKAAVLVESGALLDPQGATRRDPD